MKSRIRHSHRRLSLQKGQETIMFGLMVLFVYTPLLLGLYVIGMNLIVNIQVNNITRDMANMYIHGTDFSAYGAQQLAQRLATGLGLQIPTFGSTAGVTNTNQATNTGTSGNGIIWITQVMYVGPTTAPLCTSIGAANCTNHDSFVFTQQIVFGNSNLTTLKDTVLGYPNGATMSTSGIVSNPLTDSHAALSAPNDAALDVLWQTTSNGQAGLIDGQVVYVVESFFQTPTLSLGSARSLPGTYARYFF